VNHAARKSKPNKATAIRLDSPTPSEALPAANIPNIVIHPSILLFSLTGADPSRYPS